MMASLYMWMLAGHRFFLNNRYVRIMSYKISNLQVCNYQKSSSKNFEVKMEGPES